MRYPFLVAIFASGILVFGPQLSADTTYVPLAGCTEISYDEDYDEDDEDCEAEAACPCCEDEDMEENWYDDVDSWESKVDSWPSKREDSWFQDLER